MSSSTAAARLQAFGHADPTAATPIGQGQDFYVPHFEVKLRGRPLGRDVIRDILQVTYKDSAEEIDSFEIEINNWDAETLDFKYSDDRLFDPGQKAELWMGYYGKDNLKLMIRGEITSLRPSFPAGGQPKLTISGLNLLHHLRTQQESHVYENKKDSEIADEIGKRLGIKVVTNPAARAVEVVYPYLIQNNQYDIIFLMERARIAGYDLFVQEDPGGDSSLLFGPTLDLKRTTYLLVYGQSLIEFQPNLTTANQVGQVTVRGWDAKNKQPIEVTVKRSDIKNKGVGDRGGQKFIEQSFDQKKEVMAGKPVESKAEAEKIARDTLEKIAQDMIKGSGSTIGVPDLRAGSAVQIGGLGDRFSGRYMITATTHTCGDSGYTTQFECRREETASTVANAGSAASSVARGAAAALGL